MTLHLSYSPGAIYNQKAASVEGQKKKPVTHVQKGKKGFSNWRMDTLGSQEEGEGPWKGKGKKPR